jgi:hypothetical protein
MLPGCVASVKSFDVSHLAVACVPFEVPVVRSASCASCGLPVLSVLAS